MALYTTPAQVKTVIEVDEGDDLTPYIESANQLVVSQCLESNYTDAELEKIERWLSAHFYAVNVPRDRSTSVGGVDQTIEDIQVDLGLNVTKWGQMAMRVDYAGNLAALENSLREVKKHLPVMQTSVKWIGTPCPYPPGWPP